MQRPISSQQRAQNLAVQERELEAGALVLNSRPKRVWFALTGRCNLACVHCPRIAGVEPDIDMDGPLFEQVLEQVIPYAEEVDFGGNNLGEQIIHPAFVSAVERIREAGCRILLTSNATKLDANVSEVLARAGVRLRVSVDGVGGNYEQVRRVSWDKLVERLRAYRDAVARHPESEPALEFAMTVFADNVSDLSELLRVAKELGADKVFVQHLLPKTRGQELQSLFFHRSSANAAFESARARAAELGVTVNLPKPLDVGWVSLVKSDANDAAAPEKGLSPCYLPWTSVNVLENGDVLPCCVGGSLIMGNLKKNTFDEIWNGPAFRKLRRTVNSKRPNAICAACGMRGGTSEKTYAVMLGTNIKGRLKTWTKSYLLKNNRKKTLQRLIRVRDGVNRALSRV